MSDLEKLKFPALDVAGSNYIVWALEAYNHLCADGLGATVASGFTIPTGTSNADENKRRDAARAVILILRHLHVELKFNYLEEQNPAVVWNSLKLRFDTDRKQAKLPLLNDEWNKLCFYNFKSVTEYTTKLYGISSELSWCGRKLTDADKIEKTLTTFNPAERILATQYRRMNHDTFDKLVAVLLLDEKHGLLLQRNHDERRMPPVSDQKRAPEVNYGESGFDSKRHKHRGKARWQPRGGGYKPQWQPRTAGNGQGRNRGKRFDGNRATSKPPRDPCPKCGLRGHWRRDCRTPQFHCDLYQKSLKTGTGMARHKGKKAPPTKKVSFMTDFSDDSDTEAHCIECYDSDIAEGGDGTVCVIDSATTHVILTEKRFFVNFESSSVAHNIKTVGGVAAIARGGGQAQVALPSGTVIDIARAIYVPTSSRNLLSYVDIRKNGYHVTTATKSDGSECLRLLNKNGHIAEECDDNGKGLYLTHIKPTAACHASFYIDQDDTPPHAKSRSKHALWHDRLGHPGRAMLVKMANATTGMSLEKADTTKHASLTCVACMTGKLPNKKKTAFSSEKFKPHAYLDLLVSDVCGPISPPSGPFNYFMITKAHSSRYSKVVLLTSRNEVMPKLLTCIIHLKAHSPEHPIRIVRVDNASEFVSKTMQEFCASTGITLETSVPYAHNTIAENFVKLVQLIARPLLLRSNLPLSCWGHAVLHAGDLIRYRPSGGEDLSPYELVHGVTPSVAHLKVFGCAVYVPIPPHQTVKLGPKRQLGIYVGFQSPSIVRYLHPSTGDLFVAHISMCEFDETTFPKLGNSDEDERRDQFDFDQPETKELHRDPYNGQGEKEVRRILHLHSIAQNAPDAFAATERITRSEINEATNYPARVAIDTVPASAHALQQSNKRGRPKGSKDLVPRRRRTNSELGKSITIVPPSEPHQSDDIDTLADSLAEVNVSAFLALHDDESDPQTIEDCRRSPDWPQWKAAIKAELQSLLAREVFGAAQECPPDHTPIGCRWVFTRKRDQTGQVSRFKARLVAQGFTQRFGIDYSDTYSPVMTMTTLRWLLAFAARNDMSVKQADIETAYLYGVIDVELFMRVPQGLRVEGEKTRFKRPCVKVYKSLYGLKQAGRIWYLHFSQYLIKCGFATHECSPCLFIKRSGAEIAIIGIYVDDIVMVGTDAAVESAMTALKAEFKVKDLGQLSFCLGIQVRQISTGILLHQANYISKVLERFSMKDVSKAATTPMVVRSLKPESDVFGPRRGSELVLGPKYPYREAIGALLYLANCSRPDIAFAVSVLARYASEPTTRHWTGVKQLFRYLAKTKDYGLLYHRGKAVAYPSKLVTDDLCGFADAGYLSDSHKARSQSGYVFMSAGAAISWRSTKQTIAATSTNQSEIIALYEACREAVWLRRFITFIRKGLGIATKLKPITVYEDNKACVIQVEQGYIKSDRTKHIDPKFFFMHELNGKKLQITFVSSEKNLADLLTKSLGSTKHSTLTQGLGMVAL